MRAGERPVRRLPASTPRSSAAPRVPFVALLETRHWSYARRATTASLELYRTSDGNRSICPRCLMNSDGVTVDARAAAAREVVEFWHPDFTQELPRKLLPTRTKETQRRRREKL